MVCVWLCSSPGKCSFFICKFVFVYMHLNVGQNRIHNLLDTNLMYIIRNTYTADGHTWENKCASSSNTSLWRPPRIFRAFNKMKLNRHQLLHTLSRHIHKRSDPGWIRFRLSTYPPYAYIPISYVGSHICTYFYLVAAERCAEISSVSRRVNYSKFLALNHQYMMICLCQSHKMEYLCCPCPYIAYINDVYGFCVCVCVYVCLHITHTQQRIHIFTAGKWRLPCLIWCI